MVILNVSYGHFKEFLGSVLHPISFQKSNTFGEVCVRVISLLVFSFYVGNRGWGEISVINVAAEVIA